MLVESKDKLQNVYNVLKFFLKVFLLVLCLSNFWDLVRIMKVSKKSYENLGAGNLKKFLKNLLEPIIV